MNFTNFFNNINPKEVLNNLPDSVLVADNTGKIVWVNDKSCIIFEDDKNNLTSLYLDDIISDGFALAGKSSYRKTSVVTGAFTPSGKEFFIEMNAKRYADEYYITVRDVTAMTNILAAAEQTGKLNKEKNSMLAKLSNNFKSPLQSVIGFSQALIDGLGGDITDKQAKYVKIIHKNSKGLLHFLDKFLEFSHTESSLFKKDFRVFDLVNTIQNVIKEHESVLCEKNISLEFNSEELEKKTINSDENSIKIILNNILETSINLTDMGNITVIVKNPAAEDLVQRGLSNNTHDKNITKSFIQITVKDTGIGFSETEKSTIFDPYAAVETNNKKAILNAFILGTAYAVTNKLNGSLWINTEVMKGSEYNIILPVEKENSAENE